MKRFICSGDWHLRKTVPRCRLETEEEWIEFQLLIIDDILRLCQNKKVPLLIAGDLFDRANPGTGFVNRISKLFQHYSDIPIYAIAGNHDCPYHNFDLIEESGFGTLMIDKIIKTTSQDFSMFHFNYERNLHDSLVLCHELVFQKSVPPKIEAITAKELLQKYYKASWVICGDNHHGFHYEENKRHAVIPGSIYVGNTDQIGYQPKVYFIDTENDFWEPIYLRNPEEKLTNIYIEEENARNERIENFINSIKSKGKITFSFRDNLENKLKSTEIPKEVKKIIAEIKEAI